MTERESGLRVGIILHPDNASWIIEKMARQLEAHLPAFGFDAVVTSEPLADADIHHWMSYAFANTKLSTPASMFITHIDDPYKLSLVRKELSTGCVDIGICMSSHAVAELTRMGVAPESLTYVPPAHDEKVRPRRIVMGFMTRLYPDGRKREQLLLRLADEMRLDAFRFDIFGGGWEAVKVKLEEAGAEVRYFPGTSDYLDDYQAMLDAVAGFDYYVYLGMDEGSLGTLDALSAGVKTVITPQGFHLDLPGGITEPVLEYADLLRVFSNLSTAWHGRISSVSGLTWQRYAARHAIVWRAILDRTTGELPNLLGYAQPTHVEAIRMSGIQFALRRFSPLRIRSALSHARFLVPLRNWMRARAR